MKRMKKETIEDYAIRLFRNKEVYRLTYNEIAELLNKETNERFSEAKYRKEYMPFIKGYDRAIEDNADIEEYETMIDELYKQQVKTRDKLNEYKKTLRDEARIENLKDIVIDTIEKVEKKEYKLPHLNFNKKSRTGVLQLSDWHFGEIIDNFINYSDKEVFDKKIDKLIEQTIEYSVESNIEELVVLNQGDLISGNIHVTTRIANNEDAVEQIIYVAETLVKVLTIIQEVLGIPIRYYSVTDNHARINKNYKEHIEKENFNRIADWYLKSNLQDNDSIEILENRINNIVDIEIGKFQIYGEDFLFVHGHKDKLKNILNDLPMMTRTFPVAVFMGHLHRNYEDENHSIDLIMNPSFVGVNDFAKGIRKTSKARQKLTIYEQTNEGVERINTFFINLI